LRRLRQQRWGWLFSLYLNKEKGNSEERVL